LRKTSAGVRVSRSRLACISGRCECAAVRRVWELGLGAGRADGGYGAEATAACK